MLNNVYYIRNLENTQWRFQPSSKMFMVGQRVDGFIPIAKQTNKMPFLPFEVIMGLAHLVQENATVTGSEV